MSLTKKIEPLIEEVIVGLLFIVVGINVLRQLNNSFLGFIGLFAILWGCFKLLIGIFIYGFFLYSLIFKPESFISVQEENHIKRIQKRIKRDLDKKEFDKAINRLLYLTHKYPSKTGLKYELAELYLKIQKPINAGRLLYFKDKKTIPEYEAVELFLKSNGNSPFQILRSVTNPKKVDVEFLTKNKKKVLQLIDAIDIASEKNSWVVKNLSYYIKLINTPLHKRIMVNNKDTLINIFALIVLATLQLLTRK